jgi:DNA-binding response OmpR family regulator
MAGMNGWQFAERLRQVDTSVPVIFITGWGFRDEERMRLSALNIRRCLFKPVRPNELDAAIQEVLPA